MGSVNQPYDLIFRTRCDGPPWTLIVSPSLRVSFWVETDLLYARNNFIIKQSWSFLRMQFSKTSYDHSYGADALVLKINEIFIYKKPTW